MKFLALLFLATSLLATEPPVGGPLVFAWDKAANHTTNTGYVLSWGTNSGQVIGSLLVGTNVITFQATNGPWGVFYWTVVAREWNTNGTFIDSVPSNEIMATNRATPVRLRIETTLNQAVRLDGSYDGGSWQTLAYVTNDPATLRGSMAGMMFRATLVKPPLPR